MHGWYRNLKIKYKLVIILFIEILIISIFSMSALQIAFHIFDEQLYTQATQVLNISSENIEMKLREISRLSYRIFSDADIQDSLRSIQKIETSYERYLAVKKLKDKLASWIASENYVSSVSFIDLSGIEYSAGNYPTRMDDVMKWDVISKAKGINGNNVWIAPSNNGNMIVSAREVRDSKRLNLDTLGTLIIKVDSRQLMPMPSSTLNSYGGSIMAISEGKVIFPSEEISGFDKNLNFADMRGYHILNIKGDKFFIAYSTSDYTGWLFLNIIPYEKLFSRINSIKTLMLLICLAVFFGAVSLGVKFAEGISKPIEKLTEKMKKVQSGDFETEPGIITSNNEIERLGIGFDIMIFRINTLIRENYAKKLLAKESELKALQGQINPHFLYNTLESINWLAKVNKQDQISLMVKSLGNLLRSSINNKESIITLENELIILKSYVDIQKIRYEERLDFRMEIDERFYQCLVPKMILQPIIENSINYGLEKMMQTCIITVNAIGMQDYFEIRFYDNGPGMEKDMVEKLQRGEIKPNGSGIGLQNICERIKLLFGEKYGITVDSEFKTGASICIRLPYGEEYECISFYL